MSNIEKLGLILNGSSIPKAQGKYPAYGGNGIISYVSEKNYSGETIIIGRVGANCGSVQYIDGDCWITDNALAMKVNDKYDTKYVYYLMKLLNLNSFHIGSSQPLLTQGIINKISFDFCEDKNYQTKISNLLYMIDTKIKNNDRINKELESLAKTLYDYWFLQFEFPNEESKPYKSSGGKMVWNEELKREIPEGWKIKKIEDFCDIFTGKKDVNQALSAGKYKFYSCSPDYKYSNDLLYSGKAILVSGNGSYTGRTIFVDDSFDLYQRTYATVLKDNQPDVLEYIYYSMKKFFVPRVSGGTHGSAIPYIVYNDIAKEKIAWDEKTVDLFTTKIRPIQKQILSLHKQNQQLSSLRDWLLPMLMNGQVTFKDENISS